MVLKANVILCSFCESLLCEFGFKTQRQVGYYIDNDEVHYPGSDFYVCGFEKVNVALTE